ncbi:alpha/beta hydrolase [Phycicoccus sp. CSK15P-2]|uniref:alpha/beta fold hydrolase n=1 Tax=Phycicoccus sp. CSK15P-2 TaxID=2807627 RepID=UPI00195175E3|nr:alpha/beta hydrolase [Phycicoccus sp. CSK15P-2]MBM6405588.1 alpha/beta hydrolase [Phycicoccus sp. CSK15P-2]
MTTTMERPTAPSDEERAASLGDGFESAFETVDGVRLHYVSGGSGPLLLLLPGWPQTWWEFRRIMPALAGSRRVVALDLPGMGASDKPEGGYDKKSMARVVAGFIEQLGYERADVAGHDVGSQVAFALAATHPERVERVALLDILHPDESNYEFRMLPHKDMPLFPWWFAFNQVQGLPERLIEGRAHHLIDWVFDTFLPDPEAVSPLDRAVYADAYDSPDAIRGGNGWYQAFPQDIEDLADYDRLTMPVLGMVSGLADGMFAAHMQQTLPQQAADARVVVIPEAGHYFVEEAPDEVIEEFRRFFA